jgi:aspartyl-tRNA(Asn)/glutamyl-tRNA(Gln) amidotransferase subunit B
MTNTIIGLEIHCQLNTKTKLFCGCSTDYREDEPNTHICPICLGLPGAMPRLNKKAVEYALRVAKALHLEVLDTCEFSRKNYFYPDLPKGYQITQYDKPLAIGGYMEVEADDGTPKKIEITRIHLEEDPGRLVHKTGRDRAGYSLVDYNRSGIPLIEIVTEPDLRSPKEARRFLNKLRSTLEYLEVFNGDLEGSIRVDANISIKGHNRVECKNISSYKGVEKALTFELTRQRNLIRRGQEVQRETRHFQESRGITTSSRSKEEEHDYRYFPEPDLRPLRVRGWVDDVTLPELPDAKRERFIDQYSVSPEHARTLTGDMKVADFYELIAPVDPGLAATWVADILLGELHYRSMRIDQVSSANISELLALLKQEAITDKAGIVILRIMLDQCMEGKPIEVPSTIIERLNLGKAQSSEFDEIIRAVIDANPKPVSDYRAGKGGALNFLVGQVMKETRGRADPRELTRMIREFIDTQEEA